MQATATHKRQLEEQQQLRLARRRPLCPEEANANVAADTTTVDDDADNELQLERYYKLLLGNSPVKGMQFGLLGPDEARRLSVVSVTKQRLFDHGAPVAGGLYVDTKMRSRCTTRN